MIPPYQAATEEIRRQAQAPKKLLNTAVGVGTSLIGGTALAKVLPLLNQFVPGELMRKGISKVNPRLGGFINTAINNGYSLDDIRGFLQDKFSQADPQNQQNQQSTPQSVNPLQEFETNYPDLAQALQGYINQGQSPDAAAGILKTSSSFGKKVSQLEKNVGKNFIDYVLELFGNSQQQSAQQAQQPIQNQASQSPQQPGGLNPQLLQIMNGIRTAMQNLSGTP